MIEYMFLELLCIEKEMKHPDKPTLNKETKR